LPQSFLIEKTCFEQYNEKQIRIRKCNVCAG